MRFGSRVFLGVRAHLCPFAPFCEWTEGGAQIANRAAVMLYRRPALPGPDTVNVYRPSGSPGASEAR